MSPRRGHARGGKGGAEPRARVRLRELRALEGILDGRSQHEIARTLGVSQPAVSKMVKRIEERVLADVAWRIERQRARQSLRLEFLYSEAIRAWRASHDDALRRRQRKTDGAGGGTSTVAEVISENQQGDPRYLEEARRALADLRTLWGVDAPERLSVDTTSPYASMSDEAVAAELLRQSELLRRFLPVPVPHDASKEDGV